MEIKSIKNQAIGLITIAAMAVGLTPISPAIAQTTPNVNLSDITGVREVETNPQGEDVLEVAPPSLPPFLLNLMNNAQNTVQELDACAGSCGAEVIMEADILIQQLNGF